MNEKKKTNIPLEFFFNNSDFKARDTDAGITYIIFCLFIFPPDNNTANSTSSESLDFEKINSEDTNLCSAALTSASSRLAATFSKGN